MNSNCFGCGDITEAKALTVAHNNEDDLLGLGLYCKRCLEVRKECESCRQLFHPNELLTVLDSAPIGRFCERCFVNRPVHKPEPPIKDEQYWPSTILPSIRIVAESSERKPKRKKPRKPAIKLTQAELSFRQAEQQIEHHNARLRALKIQERLNEEQQYKCDECLRWKETFQMRVLYKKTEEGDRIPDGFYCTDCFYGVIDYHGRSAGIKANVYRAYARYHRVPTLDRQESLSMDEMKVRCTEHRDLRWEYNFGKNLQSSASQVMRRRVKQSSLNRPA